MQVKDKHSRDRDLWAVRRRCDATITSLASLASEDPCAIIGVPPSIRLNLIFLLMFKLL
jgi:hypothetical protein